MYRQNAKISAWSSGKLDKYECLTEENLGYRPDPVQKAKFEYSPLGQVFNKELDVDEKHEGLLKRLKNIEDKTDNQLLAIEGKQSDLKSIGYTIRDKLPKKTIKSFENMAKKDKEINYKRLYYTGGNNVDYDFTGFLTAG